MNASRLMMLTSLLCLSGCAHKPLTHIDDNWASPLDGDLRQAIRAADSDFAAKGWTIRIRWAGTRGAQYNLERDGFGQPLRQSVEVLYAFDYPSRSKCYLSPDVDSGGGAYAVRMAREHLGGGNYGPPRIIGFTPLRDDGEPIGPEILCDAVDKAQGGVHVDAASEAAVVDPRPKPDTRPAPSLAERNAAFDPELELANLRDGTPASCQRYARARCTQTLPTGTDRKFFCDGVIKQVNGLADPAKADASCQRMLEHMGSH